MKILFTLLALSPISFAIAQKVKSDLDKNTDKTDAIARQTNEFVYFTIPASINGSNIDPTPVSNISSSFTESKLSLKVGFPWSLKPQNFSKSPGLKRTGFAQIYAGAQDGVSTLWKTTNPQTIIGLSGGFNWILGHYFWNYSSTSTETSSESMNWLSVRVNAEHATYKIFNDSAVYGSIMEKRTEPNGAILVSFNRYFYSEYNSWRRLISCIYSIGVGYARTNNYSSLKERELHEGVMKYNTDSSAYQSVTDVTSGRIGTFEVYSGFTAYGEVYFPLLVKRVKFMSLYFGNKITLYGIGENQNTVNANTGFYFNLKDHDDIPPKMKDVANFSVTVQFDQLNKATESDFFDKNVSVLLQASVPLRFN